MLERSSSIRAAESSNPISLSSSQYATILDLPANSNDLYFPVLPVLNPTVPAPFLPPHRGCRTGFAPLCSPNSCPRCCFLPFHPLVWTACAGWTAEYLQYWMVWVHGWRLVEYKEEIGLEMSDDLGPNVLAVSGCVLGELFQWAHLVTNKIMVCACYKVDLVFYTIERLYHY